MLFHETPGFCPVIYSLPASPSVPLALVFPLFPVVRTFLVPPTESVSLWGGPPRLPPFSDDPFYDKPVLRRRLPFLPSTTTSTSVPELPRPECLTSPGPSTPSSSPWVNDYMRGHSYCDVQTVNFVDCTVTNRSRSSLTGTN